MTEKDQDTALATVRPGLTEALEKLRGGAMSLSEVWDLLAPAPKPVEIKVPEMPVITEPEEAALKRLPEVFGKVVAEDHSKPLSAEDITKLIDERQVLDVIEKLIEKRKNALRLTVLNHHDAHLRDGTVGELPPRDSEGHLVMPMKYAGTRTTGKCWSVEVSGVSVTLTVDDLRALVADSEIPFTQEDFDACTVLSPPPPPPPPRRPIVSEDRMRTWILARKDGLDILSKAARRSAGTIRVWIRSDA